jgi:hypothetical protein
MQNIAEIRGMLGQIGAACVQITLGCEDCQHAQFDVDVLSELESALGALHENAKKLRENAMSIDKFAPVDEPDSEIVELFEGTHDGDTQPTNALPEQPVCKCGHPKTDHMHEGPFMHAVCIRCECEGFEQ